MSVTKARLREHARELGLDLPGRATRLDLAHAILAARREDDRGMMSPETPQPEAPAVDTSSEGTGSHPHEKAPALLVQPGTVIHGSEP